MTATNAELEAWVRDAVTALQAGKPHDARALLERVTATGRTNVQIWMLLAHVCRATGDGAAQDRAIDEVLRRDADNIRALIWKGDTRVAARDEQGAMSFYERAMRLADGQSIPPDLATELERAGAAAQAASLRYRTHLEDFLTSQGLSSGARSPRFQESLDILFGEKRIFYQQPSAYYYPQLPQRQYYEREEFDWVAPLEAQVDAIRAELAGLLETREGFRPYLVNAPDRPRTEFHGLTDNPDWSTLYLWENGEPVTDHIARCPRTFDAIRQLPLCDIAPRAPTIMFSLLRAGARIPAHTGIINARLICHLPLVVPPGCGFRVGNEVREWEVGKLLIFDDTIEHEAWNESDEDRVVLIFDIWRPEVGEADRAALQAVFAGIDAYAAAAR
ncbi:aspartyl/asparaginyl beta-hydroxylase domain-containing protein [Sphingomonas sp. AR_OL41]|uniref:aspartyl/asparaginyl beta-hydroxylase domain-containing protein n=1 Tax=Sphingomonas sp. AR_OL41 TaxID=3042729 RepID=UPI00247FC256|nr:aspartyl/asparaginyl beta-hydroxylase domain-containing protein [Sphingomonas sp. AR_OL41]MDH7973175.1 aspartyl/asparaginyl beta-hydroxylase domain-containing protein [Sphingomonas sp. AR_OL41]